MDDSEVAEMPGMNGLFLLSESQLRWNGLRGRDAPGACHPPKTLYNRFIRWTRLGVFSHIFEALALKGGKPDRLMIDSTLLNAYRTAASLLIKGPFPAVSGAPRAA
jgi:transposase